MPTPERYASYRERGRCMNCSRPAWNGKTKCQPCISKEREGRARLYAARKEEEQRQRDAFISQGLCAYCRKPSTTGKSRCESCSSRKKTNLYHLRLKTIEAYGGACRCCGEDYEVFLEFDHVNNDGKEHRALIGSGGWNLYKWLERNGYPDMIQLLCSNCHQAKTKNQDCRHRVIFKKF